MKNTLKRSLSVFMAMLMLVSCWVFTPVALTEAAINGEYDWSLTITCVDDFEASAMTITVTTVNGDESTYNANDSRLGFSSSPSDHSSDWLDMFEKGTDQTAVISGTSVGYPETIALSITQADTDSTVSVYAKATVDSISVPQQYQTTSGNAGDVMNFSFDFSLYVPGDDLSEDYVGTGYTWSIPVTVTADFFASDPIVTIVDVLGNTTVYTENDMSFYCSSFSTWYDMFKEDSDTTGTFSGTSEYYPSSITFSITSTHSNTDCMYNFTVTVGTDELSYTSSPVYVEDNNSTITGQVLTGTASMSEYNPKPTTHSVTATTANTTASYNTYNSYSVTTNYVDNGEGQMDTSFVTVIFYDQYGQPIFGADSYVYSNSSVFPLEVYEVYGPYVTYKITMDETSQAAGATSSITGNVVIRCQPTWANGDGYQFTLYTTVNDAMYTYTYTTNEGTSSTVTTQTANYGTPVSVTTPTKDYYTFQGWFNVKDDDFTDDATPDGDTLGSYVTSNSVWYASWEIYDYDVIFNYLDSSTVVCNVDYNGTIEGFGYTVANATKDPDNDYHYTFSGWSTNGTTVDFTTTTKITTDLSVTPVFTSAAHTYYADSWTTTTPATCSSNAIQTNTCITCKYASTREVEGSQLEHEYTELVENQTWEAAVNIAGQTTYKCATCELTQVTTTPALRVITFDLGNNETYTATVTEGEGLSAEQIAELAAKTVVNDNENEGYSYEHTGWKTEDGDYYSSANIGDYLATATDSQTLTPFFSGEVDTYDLYYVIDGVTKEKLVEYGANILDTLKDVNTDKASTDSTIYTFDGWYIGDTKVTDSDTITADTTVTAKYNETIRTYTVTIEDEVYTVEYGQKLSADDVTNTDPTKAYDETYHYTFSGWVLDGTETSIFDVEVTTNLTAVESFTATEHTYGDWIVTKTPDCTNTGSRYQICSCGHAVTEEIEPTGHDYVETTTEAGENTYGSIKWICSVCNDVDESRTEVLPALRQVVFVDDDDETIQTGWYTEGTLFTDLPTNPSKENDETYMYTFAGWLNSDDEIEIFQAYEVAASDEAQTFTASYNETYIDYQVSYIDELANHELVSAHYGDIITLPTVADEQIIEHTIYTFDGWFIGDTKYASEFNYTVTGDTIFTAVYLKEEIKYTIDFTSTYGEFDDITGVYGDTVELPTPDNQDSLVEGKVIEFQYWENTETGATYDGGETYTITGDASFEAVFEETDITFTVTLVDDDGNTLQTIEKVAYKANLANLLPTETPTKEDNENYESYKFTGWTIGDTAITTSTVVDSDLEVVANFEAYYKTWTVTFVDANGDTVATETVQNGSIVETEVDEPSKDPDDSYHYTFNMWVIEGTELSAYDQNITADTTIAPAYTSTRHTLEQVYVLATEGVAGYVRWECTADGCDYCYGEQELPALYTLTFYDEDETTILSSIQKAKGTVIYTTDIETPVKSSSNGVVYTFSHWVDKDGKTVNFDDGYTITEATSFIAVFSEATYYTVKFLDYNGNLLQAKMYKDGTVLTADDLPEDPTRASSGYVSYVFTGWDETVIGTEVESDLVFTAEYDEITRQCTVTFVYADGTEAAESITVDAGETVTIPSFLTYLENDEDSHYVLESYTNADQLTDITSDVVVTVNYIETAHNFKVTTINATCTSNKTYIHTCSDCGYVKTEEDEGTTTDHTWVYKTTATTDDGYYDLYYCVYCAEEYKEYHYSSGDIDLELTFAYTDHTAVSGARVDIYKDSKFITSAYTDSSGTINVTVYVDGTYTATLTGEQFVTTSMQFTVTDGELSSTLTSITKSDCDCTCHQDTFWGSIFRFFQKIGKLFTGKYGCCDCPSEMY